MPDNLSVDVKLEASGSSPVILPNGVSAAHAQFSRDGVDLYLTSPNGHQVKVEGYFGHDPAPDLVSADGGRLSPQMVDAFLPPQHPNEIAANTAPTANDASAVGHVTEVTGDATITHTDGSHVKAEAGMSVHMGDVIQTSAKGAVHILFSDNTTFAISESARLSIDNYTYNPEEHSGTSFFSMLHGVFVYTSGLIGKHDPGNVNIETPVGSIGIRGTVVAGQINDSGTPSTITIVDGAIVVTNGGGTLQLSSAFDTATLSGYSTAPADTGVMGAQSFNTTYSAVAPADPGFYALTGTAQPAPAQTTTPDATPQTTPDGMTLNTTPDTTTTTVNTATTTTTTTTETVITVKDPYDPTVTMADPTVTVTDPTITQATFADTTATTFGTVPTGTTTFGTTSTTGTAGTTTVATTTATGTTTATVGTTAGGNVTSTGGTGGTAPPPSVQFLFSDPYLNGTPGNTADDGIPMFGPLFASSFMNTTWTGTVQLGTITTTGLTNPTFTLSGPGVVAAGGGWDIVGNALSPNQAISGITGETVVTSGVPVMHIDITATGVVNLTFSDPLGILPNLDVPGFFQNFSITASDSTSSVVSNSFLFQFQPGYTTFSPQVFIGDQLVANSLDTIVATGNAMVFGKGGDDTITVGGGNSLVLGGTGNDQIACMGGTTRIFGEAGNDTVIMKDPSFTTDGVSKIDGGIGTNVLQLGVFSDLTAHTFNLEGATNIRNFDTIMMGSNSTTTQTVKLDFQDVFDLSPTHTLTIKDTGSFGSAVIVDTLGGLTGQSTVGAVTTITGVTNGNSVTLIIDQTNGPVAVTIN